MPTTTKTFLALSAILALSGLGSSICQAGTSAVTEHNAEQLPAAPACTLTHDSSLPGHFMILRLCQLEQQGTAAAALQAAPTGPRQADAE